VDHVQVSLILPGWNHKPGLPHLVGLEPLEPGERPGTFTLPAGMMLTDQVLPWSGNLWIWPGSHEVVTDYLRQAVPEAIRGMGHPTLAMASPEQVLGHGVACRSRTICSATTWAVTDRTKCARRSTFGCAPAGIRPLAGLCAEPLARTQTGEEACR
jgi:hypothetical protein